MIPRFEFMPTPVRGAGGCDEELPLPLAEYGAVDPLPTDDVGLMDRGGGGGAADAA